MNNYSREEGEDGSSDDDVSNVPDKKIIPQNPNLSANKFQHFISSRRTVSNFMLPQQDKSPGEQFLQEAISRGVQCAATAPNHKITEPTTFHRILTPSVASTRLSDIAYKVTFQRLIENKLSGEEACRSEAMRKREKWSNIPAFVAVTVSGMEDQTLSDTSPYGQDPYKELPYVLPATIRQLEDYASACASIQNLLLSLHSEGLGAKWATGPVINTNAFRELIQCGKNDMVAGLIMIGWPKQQLPRMRRRRGLEGDLLKDVDIDAADAE